MSVELSINVFFRFVLCGQTRREEGLRGVVGSDYTFDKESPVTTANTQLLSEKTSEVK